MPDHTHDGKCDVDWMITSRFVLEVETDTQAHAIGETLRREIDVPIRAERLVASSSGTAPSWILTFDFDLTHLSIIDPDNAVTRIKYVIRNLAGATWQVHTADDLRGQYVWSSQQPPAAQEELVHPAVRSAVVEASTLG
jgi:hypothetical protein